ncbi:hypothetical protein Tco_1378493 [Tanacetum coccineum]
MSKLDRFLVSEGLLMLFPSLSALCLERHLSDHRPIIMREVVADYGPPPFLFKSFCLLRKLLRLRSKLEVKRISNVLCDENSKFLHGIINMKRSQLALLVDAELECDFTILMYIKRAVWDCGTNKSPGRDGFTFDFIRTYWKIGNQDVVNAIGEFFVTSKFPPCSNSSFIALIPKKQDAKLVKDFRPISLIGCFYKIIAKILANRLSMVYFQILLAIFQSAIVPIVEILDVLSS